MDNIDRVMPDAERVGALTKALAFEMEEALPLRLATAHERLPAGCAP
ncbi:hypothetical protein [Caballeronia glebae]|nr:hypothetical protein [Caballeronia glebae]